MRTLFLAGFFALSAQGAGHNVLIVDSSFAPLKGSCPLIDEGGRPAQENGACFDEKLWRELSQSDAQLFQGYLDGLSGRKQSVSYKLWHKLESESPSTAKLLSERLKLATHGSRSLHLLEQASQGQARALLVRNLSSQVGSTPTASAQTKAPAALYGKGCGLVNWPQEKLQSFADGRLLLFHQQKLEALLRAEPSIKVINLSLGYRKDWIREDNPRCPAEAVDREFDILIVTWKALIERFPDRLFFVAAGNESEDFSQAAKRSQDLWAILADLPNLLLVGSLGEGDKPASFSNRGLPQMLWEKGLGIELPYPLPGKKYSTLVSGTSASAPLVAGKILKLMEDEHLSTSQVLARLHKAEGTPTAWAEVESACQKSKEECSAALLKFSGTAWEPLRTHLQSGQADWSGRLPIIELSAEGERAGQQKLVQRGKEMLPLISLAEGNDLFERLITLNHEITHFAHTKSTVADIGKGKKIAECLTPYQLALLKDETSAFRSEIEFWKKAPDWFRDHFKGQAFESRLLAAKVSDYDQYYTELERRLQANPHYISLRYIELGEYPACARELL